MEKRSCVRGDCLVLPDYSNYSSSRFTSKQFPVDTQTVLCMDCNSTGCLRDPIYAKHFRMQGHMCFAQFSGYANILRCIDCGDFAYVRIEEPANTGSIKLPFS
jgi:hypothetical protein